MSQRPVHIRRDDSRGDDFATLHERGMAHIRTLAGETWTDHGVHDPGVTLLEALCFALSDAHHRTQLPIEDLLVSRKPHRTPDAEGRAQVPVRDFATVEEALVCNPVTALDWRKILIHRVAGVRNVWLRPAAITHFVDPETGAQSLTRSPNSLAYELFGVWDLVVDADPGADFEDVSEKIREVVREHRGLCEDVDRIRPVADHPFRLCVDLTLRPEADATAIKARAFRELQAYLHPPFTRRSLDALRTDGAALDEAVQGPALLDEQAADDGRGYFDDEELAAGELRKEVAISDVLRILHGLESEGLVAVERIEMLDLNDPNHEKVDWVLDVLPGRRPQLALAEFRCCAFSGGYPLRVDDARVDAILAAPAQPRPSISPHRLTGAQRDIERYRPAMHDLPAAYGSDTPSLDDPLPATRRIEIRQLQGYLLPAEQLLANHLAQLANATAMLTPRIGAEGSRTFHGQALEQLGDDTVMALLPGSDTLDAHAGQVLDHLTGLGLDFERKRMILDHLLGRFAEDFADYAVVTRELAGVDGVRARHRLLEAAPRLAAVRGKGTNTGEPDLQPSGLEQRLAVLLAEMRWFGLNVSEDGAGKFRFQLVDPADEEGILLRSTKGYATPDEAREAYARALLAALEPGNFSIGQAADGTRFVRLVERNADDEEQILARRDRFDTVTEARENIDRVVRTVARARPLVIENILLRPRQPGDPMLTACVDDPEQSIDTYSGHVIVLVPLQATDIQKREYRYAIDALVRASLPAHVRPRLCFVSADRLADIRDAWLTFLAAAPEEAGESAERVLDLLGDIVNPYPPRRLHPEGEAADPEVHILLGHTMIGSPHGDSDDEEPDDGDDP